jgi:predicted 3-demethylubiquinone-9 3-methyltransferase (glyoxalase superfamily)
MLTAQRISPCLWFDDQAEEAVAFYTSIFKNSRLGTVLRYGHAGKEIHGRPAGSVMSIEFELDGLAFTALNGGPVFTFNEAISFQILCQTEAEVDEYWERLSEGGDPTAQQCGWLKDKYGVSWQVIPVGYLDLLKGPDPERTERVTEAMLKMRKLDLAALRRAFDG